MFFRLAPKRIHRLCTKKQFFFVGTDPSNRISEGRRGAKHQEAIHMDHRDQMPQLFQCFVFKAIAGANGAVETWVQMATEYN